LGAERIAGRQSSLHARRVSAAELADNTELYDMSKADGGLLA
jgi:hypothetical protein